ncbi:MAG: hypothetical protein VYA26_10195 [Actinomycetota bacterium]|nr:hypothetical protein [Actinomycetota bacterium]
MDERQFCVQRAVCASPRTIFPVTSETNLRATLGILARTIAPGPGRLGAGED